MTPIPQAAREAAREIKKHGVGHITELVISHIIARHMQPTGDVREAAEAAIIEFMEMAARDDAFDDCADEADYEQHIKNKWLEILLKHFQGFVPAGEQDACGHKDYKQFYDTRWCKRCGATRMLMTGDDNSWELPNDSPGWQPIETAPKDGTWVMLLIPWSYQDNALPKPCVKTAQWVTEQREYWEEIDSTTQKLIKEDCSHWSVYEQASHWMSLPAAPAPTGE